MSEQPPLQQPPIFSNVSNATSTTPLSNNTQIPVGTPVSDIMRMVVNYFPIIIGVFFVLIFAVVLFAWVIRGRRLRAGVYGRVLKGKGDCYGVLLDLNSNEMIIVPMTKVSSNRYAFTYRKSEYIFIPVEGRPYIVRGLDKPVYLGVLAGEVGMEGNPELFFASGIVKAVAHDIRADLDSENVLLDKLILKVAGEQSTCQGRIPTFTGISFEVSPAKLVLALYRDYVQKTIAILNVMSESWRSIEALSKARKSEISEYGRLIVFISIAGIIAVVALALAKFSGVI